MSSPPVRSDGGKFLRVPQANGREYLSDFYQDVASYADDTIAGDYLDHNEDHELDLQFAGFYAALVTELLGDGVIGWEFHPEDLAGDYLTWNVPVATALNVDYNALVTWMIDNGYGGQSATPYFYQTDAFLNPIRLQGPASISGAFDYMVAYTFGGTCHVDMVAHVPGVLEVSVQYWGPQDSVVDGGRWWFPAEPGIFRQKDITISVNGTPVLATSSTGPFTSYVEPWLFTGLTVATLDTVSVDASLHFYAYWDPTPAWPWYPDEYFDPSDISWKVLSSLTIFQESELP